MITVSWVTGELLARIILEDCVQQLNLRIVSNVKTAFKDIDTFELTEE